MKLAILASNVFDLPTGQQKIQRKVISALLGTGNELLLITTARHEKEDLIAQLGLAGCRLLVLSGPATIGTYLRGYRSIRRSLQQFRPELIFSFGCASVALGANLRKRDGLPWVHFAYEIACFSSFLRNYFIHCLKQADTVICTSRFLKNTFGTFGVIEKKITVLKYNFGDPGVMVRGGRRIQTAGRKNLLFWGDAVKGRGIEFLLQVIPPFLEAKKVTLSLVLRYIDNQYLGKLHKIDRLPGVKIVRGALEPSKLRRFLIAADIVVLPYTKTTIQPPLTLLESVGSEKLVITTNVEANREVLGADGDGGILIPPGSELHLRQAMEEALNNFDKLNEHLHCYLEREKWLLHPDKNGLRDFIFDRMDAVRIEYAQGLG